MGLFPDVDIKGLVAKLDKFQVLQERLLTAIEGNTRQQARLADEIAGLRQDLAARGN